MGTLSTLYYKVNLVTQEILNLHPNKIVSKYDNKNQIKLQTKIT